MYSPTIPSSRGGSGAAVRASGKQPHEDWIRAVNFEIQVPRVIRLLTYDRLPKQNLHLNRRNVLARDGHSCQYCGRHFPIHQLSLDHVVPRAAAGRPPGKTSSALPGVQCAQGRPHAARGQNETRPPPREAETKPLARLEVGQSQVRKLAYLAGRRPLGYQRTRVTIGNAALSPIPPPTSPALSSG